MAPPFTPPPRLQASVPAAPAAPDLFIARDLSMKRFFLLTACLLALTACTAAQTSVPAASPAPTEAPAATPTTVPFSVPAPYSDPGGHGTAHRRTYGHPGPGRYGHAAAPCDHPPDRRQHERHAAVCAGPVQRCSARPGRPQEKPFLIPHKNNAAQAFSGLRGVLSAGA